MYVNAPNPAGTHQAGKPAATQIPGFWVCFHKLSKHKDRTEGIRERVEEKQQEGKGKEKLEEER